MISLAIAGAVGCWASVVFGSQRGLAISLGVFLGALLVRFAP